MVACRYGISRNQLDISLVSYRVEHSKRNSICTRALVLFSISLLLNVFETKITLNLVDLKPSTTFFKVCYCAIRRSEFVEEISHLTVTPRGLNGIAIAKVMSMLFLKAFIITF